VKIIKFVINNIEISVNTTIIIVVLTEISMLFIINLCVDGILTVRLIRTGLVR